MVEPLSHDQAHPSAKASPVAAGTLGGCATDADFEAARRFLDCVAAGVIKISKDDRLVYVNEFGSKLFSAPNRDPIGTHVRDFEMFTMHPDGTPCKFEEFPSTVCLRTGEAVENFTLGLKLPSGLFWTTVSAQPLTSATTGEVEATLVTVVDSSHPKLVEESLRQSEDRYRRLVENAPDAIVVHRGGPILFINEAGVKLWGGTSRADFIGRNVMDLVDPRFSKVAEARIAGILKGKPSPLMVQRHRRLDGSPVYVEVTGISCIYNGKECVQAIFRDVTERLRVERKLRRQRELLKKSFQRIPILIGLFDSRGQAKMLNREWKRILGWGKGFSVRAMLDGMYPDAVDRARAREYLESAQPGWRDFEAVMKDGRVRHLSWANIKLSSGDHIGIAQDVTDSRLAEQQLRQAKDELETRVAERTEELLKKNKELAQKNRFMERTLAVQEQDRTLVAYEIHDTFLQDVIGALMFVEAMYEGNGGASDERNEPLAQAQRLLRRCIGEARRMISGLRPPIIDEQGVQGGVEYLVNEFNGRGMKLELSIDLTTARFAPSLETTIFRIVQEALSNIERHSGTTRGTVSVVEAGGILRIEVRDFGKGFDPETVSEGHYGLEGMRERARLSEGTASVESAPGQGTRVVVELPVEADV